MTQVAGDVLRLLAARGWSFASAESLTGGMLAARVTSIPGASASVRGGVVAYATDVKREVLGVSGSLLASRGAVDPDVALAMARGARTVLGADVGVSTTGVAGPDPQDGRPVGTVFVAVVTPQSARVEELALAGSRDRIREETVQRALALCCAVLDDR